MESFRARILQPDLIKLSLHFTFPIYSKFLKEMLIIGMYCSVTEWTWCTLIWLHIISSVSLRWYSPPLLSRELCSPSTAALSQYLPWLPAKFYFTPSFRIRRKRDKSAHHLEPNDEILQLWDLKVENRCAEQFLMFLLEEAPPKKYNYIIPFIFKFLTVTNISKIFLYVSNLE